MVACIAGFGAWGASVTVSPNPVYASELFGTGHAAISYPEGMTPMVMLTIPGDVTDGDNPLTNDLNANTSDDVESDFDSTGGTDHAGAAEIKIDIIGAKFDGNVGGLEWDLNLAADGDDSDGNPFNDYVSAPGGVVSIVSGGRKGESSITIKVEPAGGDGNRAVGNYQRIRFALPELVEAALSGANIADDDKVNDEKTVWARAESRVVSGAFSSNAFITGFAPHHVTPVIKARDSVTLAISDSNTKTIAISDDADKGLMEFKSVKEKNKDGYVELATVTVTTEQVRKAAVEEASAKHEFNLQDGEELKAISTVPVAKADAIPWSLYDLDGDPIDEGLRGTLTVNAMGTRDLFNEDDMLFIDYDRDGKMGSGEAIVIDGDMAMGDALSVDPAKSDSFDAGGTGEFKVYYMPGGKMDINHGSMINLTAMVDYSDPTAIDEAPMKASTTLTFDGVNSDVDVYAIPFDGNGKGDKANVRVRCEAAAGCRVFLECWDDMGMRSFGKAGMIEGNALVTWDAMDIEGVIGVEEATSRHSCRILSAGMVKVQQLTRDGTSGTLVNNTYIGE